MILVWTDSTAVLTIRRSASPFAGHAMHPPFCRALLSIDRKRCLFLGLEKKVSFFNVSGMLSVKMTEEATFPDACFYCVIALADISLYPSKTTIALPYFLRM